MHNPLDVPATGLALSCENVAEVKSTSPEVTGQAPQNSVLHPSSPAGRYVSDKRLDELAQDYEEILRKQRPKLSEKMIEKRIKAMRFLVGNTPLPPTPSAPLIGATVHMKVNRAGKVRQDKPTIRGHKWSSLQDRVNWRISQSGIGQKANGTAVFPAQFMLDGSSKRMNAAAIWWVDLDIDSKVDDLGKILAAVIRTPEQYEDFIAWAHSLGACDGYSTASHDPENGRFHAKLHFPLPEPISYLERAIIGNELRRMVAARYGIEVVREKLNKKTRKKIPTNWACIDPVAERGVQLHHNPRTLDLRRWAQHRSFPNICDQWFALDELRNSARQRIDAETTIKKAERKRKIEGGESPQETIARAKIEAVDLSERQKKAVGRLAKLGQAEEGNHGDDTTFQAIGICIKCGLSLEEAMPILLDWDDDNDPPWGDEDLQEYAERVYEKAPDYMVGCALPPVVPRHSLGDLLSGSQVFDLEGPTSAEVEDRQVSSSDGGGVHQNFHLKDNSGIFGGVVSPDAVITPKGRILLPGGGSIPRPKYATLLDTPVLPAMTKARLRARVTIIDSACCTQKTRSLIPLIEEFKRDRERVVGVVPSQSLSSSQSTDFGLPSHLDPVVRWEGSLVTCFDSVHKIKLSTWVGDGGFDLSALEEDGKEEVEHPIAFVFFDELNELSDLRTGKTLRDVHRCDLVQGKLEEMAQDPSTHWIFQTAHTDLEALMFVLNDIFGWGGEDCLEADYEIICNVRQVLTPDIFIGHDPEKFIQEIAENILEGRKAICFASTKLESEDIGRQVAIRVMHSRACMDVGMFCGMEGEAALAPPEELKDLQEELFKLGTSIQAIRPKVFIINADNMTLEAQAALKDPRLLDPYDLIVHTSSIRSGFNIDRERAVFARLVEGAGPAAESNHQAVLRCRRPMMNRIRLCITGSAPIQSTDWKVHHEKMITRRNDSAELLKGISDFREARRDGTKYLVIHNPMLVEAEARRLARIERQTHIADRFDPETGKLIQAGAQARFWTDLGWKVHHLHEMEVQRSWDVPEEKKKVEKKKRKERLKTIRKVGDGKVAAASGMDKETADKMKKTSRLPEVRRQVENATIRWRYGMETISAEDVEWDHKHWHEVLFYSVVEALKKNKAAVLDTLAEKDGPIWVCQRHEAARAAIALRWLTAMGLDDLPAYIASGKRIPSLGLYLEQNPLEKQACADHFGFRLWDCDLEGTVLTRKFLGSMGIEFDRKQRMANGEKVWDYYIKASSVATMNQKAGPSITRLLDPEQASRQWSLIEEEAKRKAVVAATEVSLAQMRDLLKGILDEEVAVVPKLSVVMD